MEIDYIRVYQRTPQSGMIDLCNQNQIIGNSLLCGANQNTYQYSGPGQTVNSWTISSNLILVSSNSNSITVTPVNNTVNGIGTIQANFNPYIPCPTTSFTKSIWIGKPNIPTVTTVTHPCDECFRISAFSNSLSQPTYTWNISGGQYSTDDCAQSYPYSIPYNLTVSNQCGSVMKNSLIRSLACSGGTVRRIALGYDPNTDTLSIKLFDFDLTKIEKSLIVSSNNESIYKEIDISDSIKDKCNRL